MNCEEAQSQTVTINRATLADSLKAISGALGQVNWVINATPVGRPQLKEAASDIAEGTRVLYDILNEEN